MSIVVEFRNSSTFYHHTIYVKNSLLSEVFLNMYFDTLDLLDLEMGILLEVFEILRSFLSRSCIWKMTKSYFPNIEICPANDVGKSLK